MHWARSPSPTTSLYEPESHGSGALAPCSQYEPGVQSKHTSLPLVFMNLPAAHLVHVPCSTSGCTVPGLHAVGSVAPVEQNDPDGHATQSSSLVIDMPIAVNVLFWWRPDGHGSGDVEPSSQYEPGVQSTQLVAPGSC